MSMRRLDYMYMKQEVVKVMTFLLPRPPWTHRAMLLLLSLYQKVLVILKTIVLTEQRTNSSLVMQLILSCM